RKQLHNFVLSEDRTNQLQASIEQLRTQQANTSTVSHQPRVKPHEPDTFHGVRSKLRSFITSLRIYISFNSTRFTTERSKVLFACSFLRDSAFAWVKPLLRDSFDDSIEDEEDEILDNFENFLKHLQQTFGDIDTVANTER